MCIIVCKPKGKPLPDDETLKNCFVNNNDGAGFSFVKDNRVFLSKGYKKWKPFIRVVRKFIKEETPAILHFRIASVGTVSEGNCHPFVLSENKREINKTTNCTKSPIFAHNGNLPIEASDGKSDTRQYAKVVGDPLIKNNLFRNDNLLTMLARSVGSFNKLAFMNRKGEMRLLGDFEEEKGIYFSNRSYNYRRIQSHIITYPLTASEKERQKEEKEEDERDAGYNRYYDEYDECSNRYGLPFMKGFGNKEEEDRGEHSIVFSTDKEEEDKAKEEIGKIAKKILEDKEDSVLVNIDVSKPKEINYKQGGEPVPYVSLDSECEVCKNTRRNSEFTVYYYPDLDSSLCECCWNLYFGEFREVVNDIDE